MKSADQMMTVYFIKELYNYRDNKRVDRLKYKI